MTDNLRDTHFLGFAKLLYEEMRDELDVNVGLLIAQRAYDLAYHVTSMIMGDTGNIDLYVNSIPDLTEWPPTEREQEAQSLRLAPHP